MDQIVRRFDAGIIPNPAIGKVVILLALRLLPSRHFKYNSCGVISPEVISLSYLSKVSPINSYGIFCSIEVFLKARS